MDHSANAVGVRRFHFSLRTLFLVAILLALAVSHFLTSLRLRRADLQLEQLHNEIGYLTISNRSRVHVIEIPTVEDYTFRWRVYLPPGRKFWANVAISDKIPREGFPTEQMGTFSHNLSFGDHPNEFILTVAARQDGSGRWKVVCYNDDTTRMARSGIGLRDSQGQSLLANDWRRVEAGKGATESIPAGEPLALLRWGRPDNPAKDLVPTDGVMVWIEERK
jgi:hypothetical protein